MIFVHGWGSTFYAPPHLHFLLESWEYRYGVGIANAYSSLTAPQADRVEMSALPFPGFARKHGSLRQSRAAKDRTANDTGE